MKKVDPRELEGPANGMKSKEEGWGPGWRCPGSRKGNWTPDPNKAGSPTHRAKPHGGGADIGEKEGLKVGVPGV